ncbi:1-phosphatidylinositol phosphodiesterase-like [Octopus vulgaris]|uniref:1-phosphatidylinositol phosphodiesterase-like n=1 Tax=Octopus vulgaris TaxID=6645 RepID=A0AA36BKG7_OCTVU|nr:1-phosphatidylinositol phosphodiesterase-like [Octopus vulgaris]
MVLSDTLRFLTEYPRETIFMRIKEEYEPAENNRSFEETLKVYIQQYIKDGRISSSFSSIPILGNIRGKIVILKDFPGSAYGLNYEGGLFSIEDHWNVPTLLESHIGDKWQHVKRQLDTSGEDKGSSDYPTETIFMRIKEEYQTVENSRSYEETLKVSIQKYIEDGRISSSFSSIPILGDIRGKIVILQNFPGSAYGLNYRGGLFSIEDHWHVPTILGSHIGEKWQHVKRQLDTSGKDEGSSVIYVTFTSGASSGAYPNAVADRINWRLEEYLRENKPKKRFGFIAIDFPSSALIEKIIQCNH